MSILWDATPVHQGGSIQPGWPTPPAPPFQNVPSWNEPPESFGFALKPLSTAGDFRKKAFLVGPGTGHFGW